MVVGKSPEGGPQENRETVPVRQLPTRADCHSPVHPACAFPAHFREGTS
jgi:hypothetical protein